MRTEPGEVWYYNGGTTILLSDVIQKVTGERFLSYADQALLKPLGITNSDIRNKPIRNGVRAEFIAAAP